MEKLCEKCGSPLGEKDRFCTVCGTPVPRERITQERYCVQCGNLLKPGRRFCEICGREVAVEKPKEEPKQAEPTTMDELIVPEITDDMFTGSKGLQQEKFDGFEAAVMPDMEEPKPQAPAPTPEFSMDTAAVSDSKPKQTVRVKAKSAATNQTASNPAPQPTPVINSGSYTQPQSAPQQPSNPAPAKPVSQNGTEKKGGKNIIPIVLIVLIVLVLVIDAIIFIGHKNKDANETEKDTAVIEILENTEELDEFQ